jgi:hypothetical protein
VVIDTEERAMQKKELKRIKERNQAAKLADTSNVTDIRRTVKGVTGFNWQGTGNERTSTERAFMPNANQLYFGKKPTGKARERFLDEIGRAHV